MSIEPTREKRVLQIGQTVDGVVGTAAVAMASITLQSGSGEPNFDDIMSERRVLIDNPPSIPALS